MHACAVHGRTMQGIAPPAVSLSSESELVERNRELRRIQLHQKIIHSYMSASVYITCFFAVLQFPFFPSTETCRPRGPSYTPAYSSLLEGELKHWSIT